MTDQCKNCSLRGCITKCKGADCFHHENWYAVEQQKIIDKIPTWKPRSEPPKESGWYLCRLNHGLERPYYFGFRGEFCVNPCADRWESDTNLKVVEWCEIYVPEDDD